MTIDTPGGEDTLSETVLTWPADVVHNLVPPVFDDGIAYAPSQFIQHFVPTYLGPFSFTAFSSAFERVKYAIGILDLIKRCGTFRAIAPARSGMLGVTFKLLYLASSLVDIGQESARRLAVEARGGN